MSLFVQSVGGDHWGSNSALLIAQEKPLKSWYPGWEDPPEQPGSFPSYPLTL